jgi:type IV secretory pathway TrbL component
MLLDVIVRSFAQMGGVMANTENLDKVIFNPAKIWMFGYDNGLTLLKAAAVGTGIGLSLVQVVIGMGTLLVFGLFGIQIILQLVGFYLVACIALILLPLGVFNPAAHFFEKAVQSVLQAGVRLMVLILVVGVAVTVWQSLGVLHLTTPSNINQPLGLFFTALLFLYLSIHLPKIAASMVGKFNLHTSEMATSAAPFVESPGMLSPPSSMQGDLHAVQTAALIGPAAALPARGFETAPATSLTSASQVAAPMPSGGGFLASGGGTFVPGQSLAQASLVQKSISDAVTKKLKKTFLEVIAEKQFDGSEER